MGEEKNLRSSSHVECSFTLHYPFLFLKYLLQGTKSWQRGLQWGNCTRAHITTGDSSEEKKPHNFSCLLPGAFCWSLLSYCEYHNFKIGLLKSWYLMKFHQISRLTIRNSCYFWRNINFGFFRGTFLITTLWILIVKLCVMNLKNQQIHSLSNSFNYMTCIMINYDHDLKSQNIILNLERLIQTCFFCNEN